MSDQAEYYRVTAERLAEHNAQLAKDIERRQQEQVRLARERDEAWKGKDYWLERFERARAEVAELREKLDEARAVGHKLLMDLAFNTQDQGQVEMYKAAYPWLKD